MIWSASARSGRGCISWKAALVLIAAFPARLFARARRCANRRKTCEMDIEKTKCDGRDNLARGEWGEDVALEYLRSNGWRLVGRRVRPCAHDRRCEIDLIVRTRDRRGIVFVEVKTHKSRSPRASRLWRIDKRKKGVLLRACCSWIMHERWHGDFRFDVVQIYGEPHGKKPPEIDHMENVPLFPPKWRFW